MSGHHLADALATIAAAIDPPGGAGHWCRCPFDRARWRAWMAVAHETGVTPATCAACGRAPAIRIEFVDGYTAPRGFNDAFVAEGDGDA